eukprot:TRINITY_DN55782_c0_g1_i1.p1 TRINITY_DN55782_c0_g1~~TRINITY_DN55782_c0_g1_i1.p1  ORF type:complete len:129 (-),score=15.48 TRINITY_DN55782_c0_g1_i1:75-461(-)
MFLCDIASAIAKQPYRSDNSLEKLTTHAPGRQVSLTDKAELAEYAWVLMLQQIPKVTEEVARAIAAKFPSWFCLMSHYFDTTIPACQRESALQDLQRPTGSSENRRLGPAISKRIYAHFTSTDPDHVE